MFRFAVRFRVRGRNAVAESNLNLNTN